ncbi:FtsB family cell division protein [Thalassovita sp.]|jgi:cell division protein FtsB|uniref:FtsB family cell division protein n=1 Tax=Thalassovita sp. TaxID=1979401 RepID=UPI003B590E41
MARRRTPALGAWLFFSLAFAAGAYFTFAAVQGSFGVFRRAEITAETRNLEVELAGLSAEVTRMENLTKRLSDDYLDLDLLDEQARSVLGMLRADELVIR